MFKYLRIVQIVQKFRTYYFITPGLVINAKLINSILLEFQKFYLISGALFSSGKSMAITKPELSSSVCVDQITLLTLLISKTYFFVSIGFYLHIYPRGLCWDFRYPILRTLLLWNIWTFWVCSHIHFQNFTTFYYICSFYWISLLSFLPSIQVYSYCEIDKYSRRKIKFYVNLTKLIFISKGFFIWR